MTNGRSGGALPVVFRFRFMLVGLVHAFFQGGFCLPQVVCSSRIVCRPIGQLRSLAPWMQLGDRRDRHGLVTWRCILKTNLSGNYSTPCRTGRALCPGGPLRVSRRKDRHKPLDVPLHVTHPSPSSIESLHPGSADRVICGETSLFPPLEGFERKSACDYHDTQRDGHFDRKEFSQRK